MTFADVIEVVQNFSDEEKAALAYVLHYSEAIPLAPMSRSQVLAELETLSSVPYAERNRESLSGAFGAGRLEPGDAEITTTA